MGGRGSSGVGRSTGATINTSAFENMTGSDRQVSWARDIVTSPYNAAVESLGRMKSSAGYKSGDSASVRSARIQERAISIYAERVNREYLSETPSAKKIIDSRRAFGGIMSSAAEQARGEIYEREKKRR